MNQWLQLADDMITVEEAEKIISDRKRDYGVEHVPFEQAAGRVLALDILADRDLPPCNRVTMDGIAVQYAAFETGIRSFRVKGIQAAGDKPLGIGMPGECIEIMTGAALPDSVDTVIRYEDVTIVDGVAKINAVSIKKGQNVHGRGRDKAQGDIVVCAGLVIDAAVISMAASVGISMLPVKKLPWVVIISTGDELVEVDRQPLPHQVRTSNSHTIRSVLQQYGVQTDMLHLPDGLQITREQIKLCMEKYDVLILSGGVSMGKFDFVPQVLQELNVTELFHKVKQRPGKPFWFGMHQTERLVFSFPGNPVSAFMCLHRYFIPWLKESAGVRSDGPAMFAVLAEDVMFSAPLKYFMQVNVAVNVHGQLIAKPAQGNGSGDFANLVDSNAFMELPLEQTIFNKGDVYRIWPFKQIIA